MSREADPIPLVELARAEEARIAISVGEIASERRPFAGGVMTRGAPGEWLNAAFGPGMRGAVEREELRELIDWYESKGIEPRLELCPFADPTLIAHLAAERFSIRLFEQVFFRTLDGAATIAAPHEAPPELRLATIDPRDDEAVDRYARISIEGFLPPATPEPIREAQRATWRVVVRHPRTIATVALLDGEPVGAAAMEVMTEVPGGPIAALFGATVLAPARRRGIQQTLLVHRIKEAAARGARFATIGGRPGEGTERNVRRLGFAVAYTKAIVTRPAPGLTGVPE